MGNCLKKDYVYKEAPYNELQNNIRPFDLIVFRGDGSMSTAIRLMEQFEFKNDEWTHVGVVIDRQFVPIKNCDPNRLYIWESTASIKRPVGDEVKSIETNGGFIGVQIRDLETVINTNYQNGANSVIGWCKLINNPIDKKESETDIEYSDRLGKIWTITKSFYDKYNGTPYPSNPFHLLASIYPELIPWRNVFSSDAIFCSQLVAMLYLALGIVDSSYNPADITPVEILGINYPKLFQLPPIVFKNLTTTTQLINTV